MRPVRSRLAISGLTHATFKVAVVWLSDLLSGRLHHEAAAIQFIGKLFFFSMLRRWSSRLGSKGPVQGTNQKITANVQGRMHALGLISLSRSTLLSTISTKRFFGSTESNLSSMGGWSKINMLQTAHDGVGRSCPSVVSGVLYLLIQPLKR